MYALPYPFYVCMPVRAAEFSFLKFYYFNHFFFNFFIDLLFHINISFIIFNLNFFFAVCCRFNADFCD